MENLNIVEPHISVVIPTYNRGICITDAIDSVLSQTYTSFEIIVVDDGSTDDTDRILAKYGDRIRYYYQKNAGVSAARNRGILESKGIWVAFLDSDDEWLPDKLALQMGCLSKHPDLIGMVCDAEIVMGEKAQRLFEVRNYKILHLDCQRTNRPLQSVLASIFVTPSWIFKKKAIEAAGLFNESLTLYEDLDFSARVALQGPWGVVPDPLVKIFRKTEHNLSVQHIHDRTVTPRNLIIIYEHLLLLVTLTKSERKNVQQRLSQQYFILGYELMKAGGCEPYSKHLFSSIRLGAKLRSIMKVGLIVLLGPVMYDWIVNHIVRKSYDFRRSEIGQSATIRKDLL